MGVDLRTTTGAVPITRDVIRVDGPEAIAYLQGQLSQDVAGLTVGASAPTLLLQPTGKVVAWLRATRLADDAVLLDVEAGHGEAVLARLRRFKLRTKADLTLATWSGVAVRGPGAGDPAPGAWAAGWPGIGGWDLVSSEPVTVGLTAPVADAADLEVLRIECGVPAMGAELTEDTIPGEAGQWLIDASVSFTKGCYTGQELVARIDSRGGNVPRPIRGLRVSGEVAAGMPVARVVDGTGLGVVTSAGVSPALGGVALAPLPRSVEIGEVVTVAASTAQVVALPMR